MRHAHALLTVSLCVLLSAALPGCGPSNPKTYPIPGRLVYDDGKPVPGATVAFNTTHDGKRVTARGQVNPDGTFALTTFVPNDGVIEGEHEVTVVPLPSGDSAVSNKSVVPAKYTSSETSQLKFTVKPDTPEILITLQRDKK